MRGGCILRLGRCRVRVLGETRPCAKLEAAKPGLREYLRHDWRGGVFGEVLDEGVVSVGDEAAWEES
jgi:MOSC domain-containing protein YiiM